MTVRRALLVGWSVCVMAVGLAGCFAVQVHQDPGGVPAAVQHADASAMQSEIPANHTHPLRARPLVAVVGHNANTELTDFVVPYGVLKRADVADVIALGTQPGPMQMFPAFRLEPDSTIDAFDARFPDGADYVVVPAVHEDDDPRLLAWVRQQWAKGATVIGVCDGAWVLARAGLLAGRRATSHWYARDALAKQFPQTQWVSGRRYVADGRVVTTTGVTASVPVTLALIQTIGGAERARAVADAIGAPGWSAEHASTGFRLSPRHLYTAASNMLSMMLPWRWWPMHMPVPISRACWQRQMPRAVCAWAAAWCFFPTGWGRQHRRYRRYPARRNRHARWLRWTWHLTTSPSVMVMTPQRLLPCRWSIRCTGLHIDHVAAHATSVATVFILRAVPVLAAGIFNLECAMPSP